MALGVHPVQSVAEVARLGVAEGVDDLAVAVVDDVPELGVFGVIVDDRDGVEVGPAGRPEVEGVTRRSRLQWISPGSGPAPG